MSNRRVWPDWYHLLSNYRNPNVLKSSWQLINTLIPYFTLWYLMVRSIQHEYSISLILFLMILSAAFLVRIFILFHDCVHGALFKTKRLNTIFGYCLGILVFTSYEDWRFTHLRHHVTYANLDRRGFGDIWTLTVNEYKNSSVTKRILYRLYRNPAVLVGFGALFNFLLHNRIPDFRVKRKERMSVVFTNLIIIAIILLAVQLVGLKIYLLIQLSVLWASGCAGIWLFYVQHQFKESYWALQNDWEPLRASMEGSSFLKLPGMLNWFSSNIGYHHIHHLEPMIPNYMLKKCYDSVPELQKNSPLTIMSSILSFKLKLWDVKLQKMVSFKDI